MASAQYLGVYEHQNGHQALGLVDYGSPKSLGADDGPVLEVISLLLAGGPDPSMSRVALSPLAVLFLALVLRFWAVATVRCFRLDAHASGIASRKRKRCS